MSHIPIKPFGAVYTLDPLWWGISIGGRHYTATIHWSEGPFKSDGSNYRHHELERDLSLRDAKLLDPEDGPERWQFGGRFRKSNRFETRAQLDRWAARWIEADAKRRGESTWLLLEHDSCNPRRAVAAQGWDKARLKLVNDLAEVWDKVPDWAREGELLDAVYSIYALLVSSPDKMPAEDVRPLRRGIGQLKRAVAKLLAR